MFFRWIVLLLLSASAAAVDITVVISDKSSEISPLRNIGSVTVSLSTSPSGKLLMSRRDEWKAVNVSPKAIVAFIETLSIKLPDGRAIERVARYEAFFHPTIIKPNDVADLSFTSSELRTDRADPEDVQPTCEVSVNWVQFEDGTTFGEPSYATNLSRERRETWNALLHLYDVYKQQGEPAFAMVLAEQASSPAADAYIEHLRMFQEKHGTAATVGRLEEHLKMAEPRSALLPDVLTRRQSN
jgi:hypothetical protein